MTALTKRSEAPREGRQRGVESLGVEILSFVVAAYGALLATYLGYLTYRRERHRVHVRPRLEVGIGPRPGLAVYVVNTGSRSVTVRSGAFVFDDGGRLGVGADSPLPTKLEDGDEVVLRVPIELVPDHAVGFAVADTTERWHVIRLSAAFHEQLALFRRLLASTQLRDDVAP